MCNKSIEEESLSFSEKPVAWRKLVKSGWRKAASYIAAENKLAIWRRSVIM
jgi:hypothetical protein